MSRRVAACIQAREANNTMSCWISFLLCSAQLGKNREGIKRRSMLKFPRQLTMVQNYELAEVVVDFSPAPPRPMEIPCILLKA
ncbi:hypothetical protein TNCV_4096571 [Trichonephila clavipes]|nr:hypothetical protein TNCV_4096571 [Trichonephila clavipes]